MIIAIIILGVVIIGLVVLINHISSNGYGDMDTGVFFGVLVTIFCVIEICIVGIIKEEPKPKAMDVYQGKTTIEYTVRDGVKTDSVVVFKENNYGTED